MINSAYGDVSLVPQLHQQLEALFTRYNLSDDVKRLVLNCRQLNYYQNGQGIHPVEVQFKRASSSEPWQVVFFASFSYPFDGAHSVELELYFHLVNGWCYQPDTGATDLTHPETLELLQVWMETFARHLSKKVFDEIHLSTVGK